MQKSKANYQAFSKDRQEPIKSIQKTTEFHKHITVIVKNPERINNNNLKPSNTLKPPEECPSKCLTKHAPKTALRNDLRPDPGRL